MQPLGGADQLLDRDAVGGDQPVVGEVEDLVGARVSVQVRVATRARPGDLAGAHPQAGAAQAVHQCGDGGRLTRVHRGAGDQHRRWVPRRRRRRRQRPVGQVQPVPVGVGEQTHRLQPRRRLHRGVPTAHPGGHAASRDQLTRFQVLGQLGLELVRGVAGPVGHHDLVAEIERCAAAHGRLQLVVLADAGHPGQHQVAVPRSHLPAGQHRQRSVQIEPAHAVGNFASLDPLGVQHDRDHDALLVSAALRVIRWCQRRHSAVAVSRR